MKAIQAENYGCTDLSHVELEQTKGGYVHLARFLVPLGAAIGVAAAKLWDYVQKLRVDVKGPVNETNQVTVISITPSGATTNITNSVRNSGMYWEVGTEPK